MNEYSKEVGYFLDLRKAIDGVKVPQTGGPKYGNAIKDTRLLLLMALENQFDHWLAAQVPFKKAGIMPGTQYRVLGENKFMPAVNGQDLIVRVKAVTSSVDLWRMWRNEDGEIIANAEVFSPENCFYVHCQFTGVGEGPNTSHETKFALGAFLQEKEGAHWEMLLDGVK